MSSTMNSSLKALHDRLLADRPEGAVHEPDSCPLCAMEEEPANGGDDMTYTEDDLKAKVDEAVKAAIEDRDAKIAELTAAQQTTETAQAVAAKDTEIAELRGDLDKAVLEAANAKAEHDTLVAWLEGEKTAAEQREAAAARKDTRLAKLKEVAAFPDDYLEQNADRFAAMSDEEFDARCAEYAALGGKPSANGEIPSGMTGLKAGLEGPGSTRGSTAVKELLALRRDPRGVVDLSNL